MYRLVLLFFIIALAPVSAQDSLNVTKIFNWEDPSIPAEPFYGITYNEIWGVAINGKEYAIIGSTKGTHIFDVTDPVNSAEVVFIPGAQDLVIHRDYHDYNGYLYMVSDEGNSTLQIADLSFLPFSAPVVYDSDTLFATTHNIFIDTLNGIMYETHGRVFSLTNPEIPVLIADVDVTTLFDHGHDLYVRNDTAYWHTGPTGLHVYDYSVSMTNPTFISSLTVYPSSGYNHSGWLNEEGNIYAFADETNGTDIKICDVSDITNINVLSTVNSGVDPSSIPHNLIIKGDYLFISYYQDGLYIFNIADPVNPVLTGFYDTYPLVPTTYAGAWGVYPHLPSGNILLSDTEYGLFVFDASEATAIMAENSINETEFKVMPNPFDEKVTISYELANTENVTIELCDLYGNSIKKFVDSENQETGKYTIVAPFEDKSIVSGAYIIRLTLGESSLSKKLIKTN